MTFNVKCCPIAFILCTYSSYWKLRRNMMKHRCCNYWYLQNNSYTIGLLIWTIWLWMCATGEWHSVPSRETMCQWASQESCRGVTATMSGVTNNRQQTWSQCSGRAERSSLHTVWTTCRPTCVWERDIGRLHHGTHLGGKLVYQEKV